MNYVDPSGMLELKSNEYVVPSTVLKALYFTTMDTDKSWNDFFGAPGGLCVTRNWMEGKFFDFLPIVKSKKEKFYELVSEHTDLSKSDIDEYYDILGTVGNIVLGDELSESESILFHERIHHYMSNELSEEELNVLYNSRRKFLSWMDNTDVDVNLFNEVHTSSFFAVHFNSCLLISIYMQSEQELYAYMAQYEIYPEKRYYKEMISEEVYNTFEKLYPEAYAIYRTMVDTVKESASDSEVITIEESD